jgi:2'-5' RNA ligase
VVVDGDAARGDDVVTERERERDGARLFVGVRPSMVTVARLGEVAEALARRATTAGVAIRWLPSATYHVTLKFLGWTRRDGVPAVVDAITRACATASPVSFDVARLGAFPSRERASVVWAGVGGGGDALGRIAGALDDELAALGFAKEKRPFHAHVTLGRLRDLKAVGDVLLPFQEQTFSTTHIEDVTLYESIMKSSGSEYKIISRTSFKEAAEAAKCQPQSLQPRVRDAIDTDDGWPRGQGPGD